MLSGFLSYSTRISFFGAATRTSFAAEELHRIYAGGALRSFQVEYHDFRLLFILPLVYEIRRLETLDCDPCDTDLLGRMSFFLHNLEYLFLLCYLL
jgi:hypothetical protein